MIQITYDDLSNILFKVGLRLETAAKPRQRDIDLATELSLALRYARQHKESFTIEVIQDTKP